MISSDGVPLETSFDMEQIPCFGHTPSAGGAITTIQRQKESPPLGN